jgi:hypothetical protein
MESSFVPAIHSDGEDKVSVRDAVVRGRPSNPVLQRLQRRVLEAANPSEVITSYDRMHHRHNRS